MKDIENAGDNASPGENDCCQMRMGQMVTSHTLPGIQCELLRELNCHSEVVVDFSGVMMVDTACIRAILTIRDEAARKNKSLRFMSSSEYFLRLLESVNESPMGDASAD